MLVFGCVTLSIDHLLQPTRMESDSFCRYASGVGCTNSHFSSSCSMGTVVMFMEWSWSFIQFQRFSIGLRSGEDAHQSMMVNGWSARFA